MHMKLKLPQDILNEIAQQMNPVIEKTPESTDASSSQNDIASGR